MPPKPKELLSMASTRAARPAPGTWSRSHAASGAFEAAICALGLTREWLPPTVNLDAPDAACDLDHVPGAGRGARVDAMLSNSFGFGGINASLVLGRHG